MLIMWSLDEDPVMPLRLIEDAGAGHPGVPNPVWSGIRTDREYNDHEIDPEWCWPDPDDPATEGCLIRLLGPVHEAVWYTGDCDRWVVAVGEERRLYTSLGRACIAAAAAISRWPGGEG
jgi:hypothetical protein